MENDRGLRRLVSSDSTVKLRCQLASGEYAESCLLDLSYRPTRFVVCVSTQIGCPYDCLFCEIGKGNFRRSLSHHEIEHQIATALLDAWWVTRPGDFEIAAMGTGEPLFALSELITAVRSSKTRFPRLSSLNISTTGIPEKIRHYADTHLPGISLNLQLSLHASDNATRRKIMPRASKYPIQDVIEASTQFAEQQGKRVVVNYLLFAGVNDRLEDAIRLRDLLRPEFFSVKISRYNEIVACALRQSTRLEAFVRTLAELGLEARVFESAGVDIGAGCGQFSNREAGLPSVEVRELTPA